jgi:hypothetical protein
VVVAVEHLMVVRLVHHHTIVVVQHVLHVHLMVALHALQHLIQVVEVHVVAVAIFLETEKAVVAQAAVLVVDHHVQAVVAKEILRE